MTTRRTDDLPTEHATAILDLLARARAAAAPLWPDGGAWAAAEAGQERINTGYKAARRTASAGQYAAHVARLIATYDTDDGADEPWTIALADAGPAINTWYWIDRYEAGLTLARTFDRLAPRPASVRPAVLVSAWLLNAGRRPNGRRDDLVEATANLCRHVLELDPSTHDVDQLLALAWYATHGPRLVAILAARTRDETTTILLRAAVRGVHAARITTKLDLAATAGITRSTLDAWLRGRSAQTPDWTRDPTTPLTVDDVNSLPVGQAVVVDRAGPLVVDAAQAATGEVAFDDCVGCANEMLVLPGTQEPMCMWCKAEDDRLRQEDAREADK